MDESVFIERVAGSYSRDKKVRENVRRENPWDMRKIAPWSVVVTN
jgi:hypothetical protein